MPQKRDESSPKVSETAVATPVPTTLAAQAEQVFKWVVAGQSQHDIVEAVEKTFAGVDAKALLIAVMERLAQSSRFEPEVVVGWCVEATRDLYRRMVEIGDFAGALRAVKQMAEMVRHVQYGEESETAEGGEGVREAQGTSKSPAGSKDRRGAGRRPAASTDGSIHPPPRPLS